LVKAAHLAPPISKAHLDIIFLLQQVEERIASLAVIRLLLPISLCPITDGSEMVFVGLAR
jgi:hypothetical protein